MTGSRTHVTHTSPAINSSAAHSDLCTESSTFCGSPAIPESLPSHFAQNMNVAAEPNASRMMSATLPVSTNDTSVAHFAISMPKGATNMHMMPSIMKRARRGMRSKSRSMSSMLRLPIWCSAVPTHRNSRLFATAWKMMSRIAAQTASGVPTPAHAVMRPRFAMVEYASTRLALLCEIAMNEHSANVRPPTSTTITEGTMHTAKIGESFTSRNTPALTMVDECRSAEVGVGATIAPRSHVWKGICAAFVMPANASKVTGSMTSAGKALPSSTNIENESGRPKTPR